MYHKDHLSSISCITIQLLFNWSFHSLFLWKLIVMNMRTLVFSYYTFHGIAHDLT